MLRSATAECAANRPTLAGHGRRPAYQTRHPIVPARHKKQGGVPDCLCYAAGDRLWSTAAECMVSRPRLRSWWLCPTQQARQPPLAVAWHQHCSGGGHTEGGVEDHAPRLWAGGQGAVPSQRTEQERCICKLYSQGSRIDWGELLLLQDPSDISHLRRMLNHKWELCCMCKWQVVVATALPVSTLPAIASHVLGTPPLGSLVGSLMDSGAGSGAMHMESA